MTPEEYHHDLLHIFSLALNHCPKENTDMCNLIAEDQNQYLLNGMYPLQEYFDIIKEPLQMIPDPTWMGDVEVRSPQQLERLEKVKLAYYKSAGCVETGVIHPQYSVYVQNALQCLAAIDESLLQKNLVQRQALPAQSQTHEQHTVVHEEAYCCGNTENHKIVTGEHMVCLACGQVVPHTQQLLSSFTENTRPIAKITAPYNRISAWFDMVSRIQGLRVSDIATDQWEKIYVWITHGYSDVSTIPFGHVQEVLKSRKLHKLYKDAPGIWSYITGNKIPSIDPIALKTIWEDVILPVNAQFDTIKEKIDPDRTNFFSNPFLLYKTFELCGLHAYLPFIQLLKGREKLERTIDLWKEHCRALHMKYYPNFLF